jgi:hypothetical protein
MQFEYITLNQSEQSPIYRCAYGLHRKRRGHTLDKPMTEEAKDAIIHIH